MSKLELIPIRESDRMADEMLSFITAGTAPPAQGCNTNNCIGNTGNCTSVNTCNQNSGNCESNGCQANIIKNPPPQPPQPPKPVTP